MGDYESSETKVPDALPPLIQTTLPLISAEDRREYVFLALTGNL